MKQGRRGLVLFLISAVLACLWALPASAAEDAITSVTVQADLQSDGAARITEIWEVRGVSGGTEYYKTFENMEGKSLHSFSVEDETGMVYQLQERWRTGRSREEKAGTCGILETEDGYELCWGIGDYGDRRYTLRYTLEGLVKDYGDYAGFYHEFVGELSSAPEFASVTITAGDTALTADVARIWAYGFSGETKIGSSALRAHTLESMGKGDYIRLLCRFDRALFEGAGTGRGTFEALQDRADNEGSNTVLFIVLGVIAVLFIACMVLYRIFAYRYKLADGETVRLPKAKEIEAGFSVPFGGSIPAVYAAMHLLRRGVAVQTLMGAYLIRLQEKGRIRIEERPAALGWGRKAKEEVILLYAGQAELTGTEQALLSLLSRYTGPDGILWSSVITERAQELHGGLTDWGELVKSRGNLELTQAGAAAMDAKNKLRFTPAGFGKAVALLGFQKYLKNMQNDRAAPRELWGDYLVFATLFAMGKQALKSMEALDPAYYASFTGHYGCDAYSMMYLMTMTDHITHHSVPQNNDGTGGSASSSGGGGFSGGGGGGSR